MRIETTTAPAAGSASAGCSPTAIVLAAFLVVLIVVLVKEAIKQAEEKQRQQAHSLGIDEQARRYGLERQPGETDLELKQRVAFFKQEERRAGRR